MNQHMEVQFFDYAPRASSVLKEVIAGLSQDQKILSPKFLYDKRGSEIFEEICRLEDYYPTRAEAEILRTYCEEIATFIGSEVVIIEPGSGSGKKVRMLLPHLDRPAEYVPVEISKEILLRMIEEFHERFPDILVTPVCGDFTTDVELPLSTNSSKKRVVFFPGSTVGNFAPEEAVQLLKKFTKLMGRGGGLLIGADLKKSPEIFKRAYDDSKGMTAAFNLNILQRLNREISAEFDLDSFEHVARYNEELGRVEMHLVSKIPQMVRVHETLFRFHRGESIHTENSYKYSEDEFIHLCSRAKLKLCQSWKDEKGLFCVYFFEKE